MTAAHVPLDGSSDRSFKRIEIRTHVEMQIESTMIHTLQADDNVDAVNGLLDPGEAGHTSNIRFDHGLTNGPDSRNCSSCRR